MAPPRISASATAVFRSSREVFHNIAIKATKATTEKPISRTVRHSDDDSANRPNAAPRFCECTISKKPGITTWLSKAETRVSMIHLVSRSTANTAPARPYIIARAAESRMQDLFDGLGTGSADGRESGIRSDISGVLPAAFALRAGCALHFHINGITTTGR